MSTPELHTVTKIASLAVWSFGVPQPQKPGQCCTQNPPLKEEASKILFGEGRLEKEASRRGLEKLSAPEGGGRSLKELVQSMFKKKTTPRSKLSSIFKNCMMDALRKLSILKDPPRLTKRAAKLLHTPGQEAFLVGSETYKPEVKASDVLFLLSK